jgi:hypothetical protein
MERQPKSLTKSNWLALLQTALAAIADAELKKVRGAPWRCKTCQRTHAGIAHDGTPACHECENNDLVPGGSVNLENGYLLATFSAPKLPAAVLAVVAGTHLVSPVAQRHFRLGMPAELFIVEFRNRALPALGLLMDDDGIWRHPNRSRADGFDAADLAFGNPGGIWTEQQIRDFHD